MASYTIRIELHDATWADYMEMYKHLAIQGITDIIISDDGVRYRMPPAEYNYEGKATSPQLLEMAKASAGKVVRSYAVLVTESGGRRWHGLSKA